MCAPMTTTMTTRTRAGRRRWTTTTTRTVISLVALLVGVASTARGDEDVDDADFRQSSPLNLRGVSTTRDALRARVTTRKLDLDRFRVDGDDLTPSTYGARSGYFALNSTEDAHLFYTFFERRRGKRSNDAGDDPIIVWLTGGPGCASELASLYENGPYALTKTANGKVGLTSRASAWSDAGHLLYVDSPVNTGFSYSSSTRDVAKSERVVARDLLEFLWAFLLRHPELADAEVFITGESYAGHYVPAFARAVFDANDRDDSPVRVNFKGLAVGNGLTDPEMQYGAYADYALGNDVVSAEAARKARKMFQTDCKKKIAACARGDEESARNRAVCLKAVDNCMTIPDTLLEDAASRNDGKPINVYDIRKTCDSALCYDFSAAEEWLNRADVQKALGVKKKWQMCDEGVHSNLMGDWMHDFEPVIPAMLEAGIRVMIYAGEKDFICNALGNLRWVKAMQWSGQDAFNKAKPEPFVVARDGEEEVIGGDVREAGQLSFVAVSEAGHMVPMDQPKNALTMIQRFVNGEPIARGAEPEPTETRRVASPRRAADALKVAIY